VPSVRQLYRPARRTFGAALGFAVSSTWLTPPVDIVAMVLAAIVAAVSLVLFLSARASAEHQS